MERGAAHRCCGDGGVDRPRHGARPRVSSPLAARAGALGRATVAAPCAGARAAQPLRPAARALVLGVLWGWLPCGLVYSVLLAAAVAGSAVGGG